MSREPPKRKAMQMNRTTNTQAAYTKMDHSKSPSVRESRSKHPLSLLADAHQVGRRVRTRLPLNPGLLVITVGWIFAYTGVLLAPESSFPEAIAIPIGLMVCAIACISFGVGWIVRDERGER